MSTEPKSLGTLIGELLGLLVARLLAIPFLVQLFWNYLVPSPLPMPEITFLQAMAISLLCSLLFQSTPAYPAKKE